MPAAPLAVSLGDPAGIGAEVIAKSWERRVEAALPSFFAVGDVGAIEAVWSGPVSVIAEPSEALGLFDNSLPVIRVADSTVPPGSLDLIGARNSLDALELAVGLTRSGAASGLVTGPVSKARLYAVGFVHPGQTEFVAERCGVSSELVAMMLAGPTLRVVPVTTHIPLADVPHALSVDRIVAKGRAAARGLQRQFGIESPRIAVAGLNPHAGENGALGREEIDLIMPAIDRLRGEGYDVTGPHPPDVMFHNHCRRSYDLALCMYHDQALIPLKTLHFDEGINVTLGLPIVRTSPDHGTAFDIAGKNLADPGAMIAAIRAAGECARRLAAA
ncbi:4-hydroxythreonine-4-phosphate dehydrogenase PdxA [Sphingosinicella sp. LHD-64]|uniref:4-hydroxythreonine-4-phosphate dehydrogenase PdxA n=1 Tax=Sphingosinicella sp. LHD-64 TaxID=3072139 RepID=UPI00280F1A69|nr:4-hydroxythreonine-4-phosphate dehydrogenase PdxA [Sphingosinicella sp. LHD-64]MDQ8754999.1 4-hydroxythreonine-4-phosphate dehydrogenase PdxA [Sphingosinicella sp. LHD-64]